MKHLLSAILDVKIDESVAGVLLGVVVTGLVAWGSSVATYWGLRRNFAVSKVEKRAAVDLRTPRGIVSASGDRDEKTAGGQHCNGGKDRALAPDGAMPRDSASRSRTGCIVNFSRS